MRKPCLRHTAAWLPHSRGVMLLLTVALIAEIALHNIRA
jgi:hypothetical protein